MFNKSNFCHIASNNRNEQKGSVFIYKTSDTLAQVTQSGYFNEKLIDINLHDLIIHVQYDPVARTLKKSVLIVTERTMDNVETAPILDQTISDDIADLGDQVQGIEEKIPGAASAANQLADKAFVNDIKTAIETTIAGINTSISTLNNDLSQTNQNLAQTNQDVDSLQETKQDKATAVNYDNITNCITEIPQDIKLELNNGTLTLKAGSKVYVPNGAGKFDILVTEKDISSAYSTGTGQNMSLLISDGSSCDTLSSTAVSSGSTDSLAGKPYHAWYDTTNNLVKLYLEDGVTVARHLSLPFAITHGHNNGGSDIGVDGIDQIFNGFGYIGSTAFVLPGVTGLAPDGRNEDGSLKHIQINTTEIITYTRTENGGRFIGCFTGSKTLDNGYISYVVSETQPTTNFVLWYKPSANKIYTVMNGVATPDIRLVVWNEIRDMAPPYKITSFEPKSAFHAVDYSELNPKIVDDKISTILNAIYPAGSLYLTSYNTAACPIAAAIPGSTWELISSGRALWTGNGSNGGSTIAAGLPNITGSISTYIRSNSNTKSGAFSNNTYANSSTWGGGSATSFIDLKFDASKSNSIYGNSTTVQPPAFVVNVWRRVS